MIGEIEDRSPAILTKSPNCKSDYPGNPAPTIVIKIGDEGWEQVYAPN